MPRVKMCCGFRSSGAAHGADFRLQLVCFPVKRHSRASAGSALKSPSSAGSLSVRRVISPREATSGSGPRDSNQRWWTVYGVRQNPLDLRATERLRQQVVCSEVQYVHPEVGVS